MGLDADQDEIGKEMSVLLVFRTSKTSALEIKTISKTARKLTQVLKIIFYKI